MIVKIMHFSDHEDEFASERHVECFDVIMRYVSNMAVSFDILDKTQTVIQSIEVFCERTKVYYMSENGKTVDSFRWMTEDGAIKRM